MLKKIVKIIAVIVAITVIGLFLFLELHRPALSENHGKIQTKLYLGESENQPLIVGFGGGEGGNAWASNYWKDTRDKFINEGYAFLAVGYFGMKNTPKYLDRISLNAIHDSIISISNNNPKIDNTRIAVIGGSKGGELVLNLASRYNDIDAVIAIVPSHANFPSTTINASTSSWSFEEEELPFIPMPWKAVPSVLKRDMSNAYVIMLENKEAEEKASIAVEKMKANVLLISATQDELWPSTLMSNKVVNRLKANNYSNYYEHIPIEGGHSEPLKHFDKVFQFLEQYFKGE